jgi:hypothetical protein
MKVDHAPIGIGSKYNQTAIAPVTPGYPGKIRGTRENHPGIFGGTPDFTQEFYAPARNLRAGVFFLPSLPRNFSIGQELI